MSNLFGPPEGNSGRPVPPVTVEQERDILRKEMTEIHELLHTGPGTKLLLMALERLRPGMDHRCWPIPAGPDLPTLNLASFYVSVADYQADMLHWWLYHEGVAPGIALPLHDPCGRAHGKAFCPQAPLHHTLKKPSRRRAVLRGERISGLCRRPGMASLWLG